MDNTEHLSKSYDQELDRLTGEIVRMGELALVQLNGAMNAVERQDAGAAARIIAADDAVDELEYAINQDVVRLLALRAPMARDLREVFAALRIATDIERIADYAANIAKPVEALSQNRRVKPARGLRHLSELATAAVREVLTAYRDHDAERARRAWRADEKLDAAYTGFFRELLTYMMEDPGSITVCIQLLFIAKHIERVGDHATNIAEDIWFVVHGAPMPNDGTAEVPADLAHDAAKR